MIRELHLNRVGPTPSLSMSFAERLNLITGDNGLGKTFLLDIIWWTLTNTWANGPVLPQRQKGEVPQITYHLSGKAGLTREPTKSRFDYSQQSWPRTQARPVMPGLVIYVRVDGSFSVWDPARNYWRFNQSKGYDQADRPSAYHFSQDKVWNGLEEEKKILCNGLVRDWVSWQNQPDQGSLSPFNLLSKVIERLSPHPKEWMKPGKPTRVSIEDVRDIPTVELPYGVVPVTQASAGMKRILGLSYLLVWTWYEHVQASELLNQSPTDTVILLIDEVESHLHPQWQRSILPAMLDVATGLKQKIKTQVIATTHSPLVLASVEPEFNESVDKLFLFSLHDSTVKLEEMPWAKQGDVVGWLVSDVFGLKQARSKYAEIAIEAAEAFMRNDVDQLPEGLRSKEQIHRELLRVVPGHDPFWPRWIVSTKPRLT
ncbi:MAG: ATP-binding protein [Chlorobiaceae bacterium]|nr:ATP-binding protein [Chlorobiaceae bacterium]